MSDRAFRMKQAAIVLAAMLANALIVAGAILIGGYFVLGCMTIPMPEPPLPEPSHHCFDCVALVSDAPCVCARWEERPCPEPTATCAFPPCRSE